MWLVLCSSTDAAALWVYQALGQIGLSPIHLVTAESLDSCRRWDHRLTKTGDSTSFVLPDGRVIESRYLRGTVNRILSPATIQLPMAVPEDRGYAAQELYAFYASWLKTLPAPILNTPAPQGLCGRWPHISEWVWLASRAGLRTPKYRMSSNDISGNDHDTSVVEGQPIKTAVVVRDGVFGVDMSDSIAASCIRLAELSGVETLGINFYYDRRGELTFASATPMPDFRLSGWPLIEKLAAILKN